MDWLWFKAWVIFRGGKSELGGKMIYKDFMRLVLIDLINTEYKMRYKKEMNEIDLKLIHKLNVDNLEILWKEYHK